MLAAHAHQRSLCARLCSRPEDSVGYIVNGQQQRLHLREVFLTKDHDNSWVDCIARCCCRNLTPEHAYSIEGALLRVRLPVLPTGALGAPA